MTDFVDANVTYSFKIEDKHFLGSAGYLSYGTITLGDGALTWPAAGLPINIGKMGFGTLCKSLEVIEAVTSANTSLGTGLSFWYDVSAKKLLAFAAGGGSITSGATSGGTPAGTINAVAGTVSAPTISLANLATAGGDLATANLVIAVNAVANAAQLGVANAAIVNITGVQAPTFTNTGLPVFTGAALATHTHTVTSVDSAYTGAPASMVLTIEARGY